MTQPSTQNEHRRGSVELYWAVLLDDQSKGVPPNVSLSQLEALAEKAEALQVRGLVLYHGRPEKTPSASALTDRHSPLSRGIEMLRKCSYRGEIMVDLCVCQYVPDAHCRLRAGDRFDEEQTRQVLCEAGQALVELGATSVMPSASLKGLTKSLRQTLDQSGHKEVKIFPQSAKFQSELYGVFRTAVGHRQPTVPKPYQHPPDDISAAVQSCRSDLETGAAGVIVKPVLSFFEALKAVRAAVSDPLGAFLTSGEHHLLEALSEKSGIEHRLLAASVLSHLQGAGADFLVTYNAPLFVEAAAYES